LVVDFQASLPGRHMLGNYPALKRRAIFRRPAD